MRGCTTRPNNGPDGRSRWQGRGRMNLPCIWPVKTHIIRLELKGICRWFLSEAVICVWGVMSPSVPQPSPAPSQGHSKPEGVPPRMPTSAQVDICGGLYLHYSNSKTKTWNHVVGLVVCCDCCIKVQLHYLQKVHSDLWLCVKEELNWVSPWWSRAHSWRLLIAWHNCAVSAMFLSFVLEKVHTCCSKRNILAVVSLPLRCFSWHLLSKHSFSLHKKPQACGGCAAASRTTLSHQLVWSREPSAPPAPWTDVVSCLFLQVTMSPISGSPKVHLKFLVGGLGGPRSRPSACSSSSPSCLRSADLPCPSASALSSRPCGIIPAVPSPGEGPSAAALVSRVTVRGKKKIPLWWLAFVEGSNQYLGHPAELGWKNTLTLMH